MPDSRPPLLTRTFVLASLTNLFQAMSFWLFIHLPGYLADLGAREVEIGMVVASTAIAAVAIRPPLGAVLDTRGRRPVILAGVVVNLVAVALYFTISSLGPWLYAVRLLHGVAEGTLFTALFAYGADIVPEERRTEGLGLYGVSGLLPIALAGVVGDLILAHGGFTGVFAAATVCAAVATVFATLLPEPASHHEQDLPVGLLKVIRASALRPVWWITGVFGVVLTGYFAFLRTFVDEQGVGAVGAFFAAYAGTAILVRLAGGRLPARVGERRVLLAAMGSLALGFALLAAASSDWHVTAAGVLCGVGHGYGFPILYSITVTRAPARDRGSAVSFFTALFDLGTLVGGPLLGAIITWGGYDAMFASAGVAIVVACAIYVTWERAAAPLPQT